MPDYVRLAGTTDWVTGGKRRSCCLLSAATQIWSYDRPRTVSDRPEEFWGRQSFLDFDTAVVALHRWERTYNVERFSLALHSETPAEKLARRLPDAKIA